MAPEKPLSLSENPSPSLTKLLNQNFPGIGGNTDLFTETALVANKKCTANFVDSNGDKSSTQIGIAAVDSPHTELVLTPSTVKIGNNSGYSQSVTVNFTGPAPMFFNNNYWFCTQHHHLREHGYPHGPNTHTHRKQ